MSTRMWSAGSARICVRVPQCAGKLLAIKRMESFPGIVRERDDRRKEEGASTKGAASVAAKTAQELQSS